MTAMEVVNSVAIPEIIHPEFVESALVPLPFPLETLKKVPRFSFSIRDKVKILEMVDEKRMKHSEIAERFGLPKSTLSTLIKNKDKILKASRTMRDPSRKRVRSAAYPELEEMLFKWISEVNNRGIVINQPQLRAKVEDFARILGIPNFRTSVGWMYNFKRRHGLIFPKNKHPQEDSQMTNFLSTNDETAHRLTAINDSDGAGSERSSDSDCNIHPVQLLQTGRQKRQRRSLCEYRPDFLYYENAERISENLIVPYVQNDVQTEEWRDSPETEGVSEPQIKIEEFDSEDTRGNDPNSTCSGQGVHNCRDPLLVNSPSRTSPPLPRSRSNEQLPVDGVEVVRKDRETNLDNMQLVLPASPPESHITRSTLVTNNSSLKSVCNSSSVQSHSCEAMMRLAVALEKQNTIQEEMLTLKKTRLSAEEKHRQEEVNLLKQKLSIEQRKVYALEQLLAVYKMKPNLD